MLTYYEVRPKIALPETDRFTEVKTATLGYFESQIFRDRADGTYFDPASLYAVADASEAEILIAALHQEMPNIDFEVIEMTSESGTRFQALMI